MPGSHSTIYFEDDRAIKSAEPERMRVEVEKTRRAYAIGQKSGLFRVPNVLDFDEARGTAVFERLENIRPVHKAIPWGKRYVALAETLGKGLATVHRDLSLPADMQIPVVQDFALPGDEVFLHGDLSVDNVCVGPDGASIILLDWQSTPLYGGEATYGTRYFDVMWFIANLIYRPKVGLLFGNPVQPIAEAFLASYADEAGLPSPMPGLTAYAERFLAIEMPRAAQDVRKLSRLRAQLIWPRSEYVAQSFVAWLHKISTIN